MLPCAHLNIPSTGHGHVYVVKMVPLILGSVALFTLACVYCCVRRAGRTVPSLLHYGATLVMLLMLCQFGAILISDSLQIPQDLLWYCVGGVCVLSLLYFLLILCVCSYVQSCVVHFTLTAAVVFFLSFVLLMEFGGVAPPIYSNLERYSRLFVDYVTSLSPFQGR